MKAGHATSAIVGDRASYEAAFAERREEAPSEAGEEAEGAPPLAYDVGEFSRERALAQFSTDHLGVRPSGARDGATQRILPADNGRAAVPHVNRTSTWQTCRASTR